MGTRFSEGRTMTYYLDSNMIIFLLDRGNQKIANKLRSFSPRDIKVPSMVRAELLTRAYKNGNEHRLDIVTKFLAPYEIVPFDEDSSTMYGKIRAELEKKGNKIGPNDMIIASTVLSHGGILVTNNVREFERVDGLHVEDWF